MREFHIPAPPADLHAVKDWRGTVWTRDIYSDHDDMFLHHWPDAETPERRSWWQLIEDGPLTEHFPESAPETINVCPCCANYITNGDDCEHYPCFASEPLKYIDVTRNITVTEEWNDRTDIECDSCGVESDYYGGLYRAVSKHYLES